MWYCACFPSTTIHSASHPAGKTSLSDTHQKLLIIIMKWLEDLEQLCLGQFDPAAEEEVHGKGQKDYRKSRVLRD